jgi:hypothetical protein
MTASPSRRIRRTLLGLAVTVGLVGSACDAQDGAQAGVAARLYTSSTATNPFDGVGWMRIFVRGEGLATPIAGFTRYAPGAAAELPAIPFGPDGARYQLVVEGWADANGAPAFLVSSGRSPWFEVPRGSEPASAALFFARINGVSDLPAVATRAAQRLQTGRVGAGVAVTGREVVVAGGGFVNELNATWWRGAGFAQVFASVEALDVASQVLSPRRDLRVARALPTVSSIGFGQAVIAGGFGGNGTPVSDVELYNPPGVDDGQPAALPPLAAARAGHTATVLDLDARLILFVGGDAEGTWELWDPVGGSRGKRPLPDAKVRSHHTATPFRVPGRTETAVMIAGGESASEVHATAMLYEPVGQAMLPVGQAMATPRTAHAAAFVADHGLLYVLGGFTRTDRSQATARIDAFDVGQLAFRADASGLVLGTARGGIEAAVLADNRVLVAGGFGAEQPGSGMRPLRSLELIYDYVDAQTFSRTIRVASSPTAGATGQLPLLPTERIGHGLVALPSGHGLIVGGAALQTGGAAWQTQLDLQVYNPQ